jgi:hypothetical protein
VAGTVARALSATRTTRVDELKKGNANGMCIQAASKKKNAAVFKVYIAEIV